MSKLYAIKFDVKSRSKLLGLFPLDMLRYDSCIPYSSRDIAEIPLSVRDIEDIMDGPITLVHYSHGNKKWQPTVGRWESFGWEVVFVHPAYSV